MTTRYLSSSGNNADGTTWASAYTTLTAVDAVDTVGDTIWVAHGHSESAGAVYVINLAGTAASPTQLLCGNSGAEPPTALATTAVIATGAITARLEINATGHVYVNGIIFKAGVGASSAGATMVLQSGAGNSLYENCEFWESSSSGSAMMTVSSATTGKMKWNNCKVKLAAAGQWLIIAGHFHWNGGSFVAGTAQPTSLFTVNSTGTYLIENVDLSAGAAGMNIASDTHAGVRFTIRNCKLPASWSGALNAGVPGMNSVWELINCDAADTHYRYIRQMFCGIVTSETTEVRTDGATDGTTPLSWKMISNANATLYPFWTLDTGEIYAWNAVAGSSVTATVEIAGAGTLKDDEIWLEVSYLGTSGYPLGTPITDSKADVLATAADQTTSSESWTSATVKQKLSVTFTPQEAGYVVAKVRLAKASTTVYVDPKLTVV